jgi:DnaJ-class molecular chaperone
MVCHFTPDKCICSGPRTSDEQVCCDFCAGSGEVVRYDGNGPVDEFPCPFCSGTGEKAKEQ